MMRNNTTSSLDVIVGLVAILSIVASIMMLVQQVFAEAAEENAAARAERADPSLFAVQPTQDTNRPAWFVGSFQLGGQWLALRSLGEAGLTNPPAWPAMHPVRHSSESDGGSFSDAWFVPADQEEGVGSLFMVLDRRILTNDLLMELTLLDKAGSSLYVDLLATNFVTVGTNLCGNVIEGSNEVVCVEVPLALSNSPSASIVRLWRGAGEVLLYQATLVEDVSGTAGEGSGSAAISRQLADTTTAEPAGTADADAAENAEPSEPASVAETNSATTSTNKTTSVVKPKPPKATIVYVAQATGNDSFTGNSLVRVGKDGPKKTIKAGLAACRPGSILQIKEGRYGEDLNVAGRSVSVQVEGNVDLSGHFRPPAEVVIPPDGVTTNTFK